MFHARSPLHRSSCPSAQRRMVSEDVSPLVLEAILGLVSIVLNAGWRLRMFHDGIADGVANCLECSTPDGV